MDLWAYSTASQEVPGGSGSLLEGHENASASLISVIVNGS